MPNNIELTESVFAGLVLIELGGALQICRNMSHRVTKEFTEKPGGNPVGASVMVRKPYRFTVAKGLNYQPQPTVDTMTPVTLNQVAQVSFDWNSYEKTLLLRDAMEWYIRPMASAMASTINAEAGTFIAQNTFNSVGTPGTAPVNESTYLSAGDLLVAQGLPEKELGRSVLIINRRMSSAFVSGMRATFNPQTVISKQLEEGEMYSDLLGYRIEKDQTINQATIGTYSGSPVVNGANQTADGGNNATMVLNTNGWGSGTTTINQGDKFVLGSATSATVGGVNSTHPQTHRDTGYQQQFTVLQTISDTAGAINMLVSPAITPYAQYQNVTAAAVANAIITLVGASGATAQQGILVHPEAFAFVSAPLEAPRQGEGALVKRMTDPRTGISMRIINAFDYKGSGHINRADVLYDFSSLYREACCVIQA